VKIVVGLGNPGERYERTPHNAGFLVLDELARRAAARLRRSFRAQAYAGRVEIGGAAALLVKPLTYMNESGRAVASLLRYHRAGPADLLVVLDDADLQTGRLRLRAAGSAGGHRGLQSVIEAVGTQAFARVRVGIGRGAAGRDSLVEHVLGRIGERELALFDETVRRAADAVETAIREGIDAAMNRFNAAAGPESGPEPQQEGSRH
jgi:PTH1 family peptidyl-tRNA hydrolase